MQRWRGGGVVAVVAAVAGAWTVVGCGGVDGDGGRVIGIASAGAMILTLAQNIHFISTDGICEIY